MAHASLKTLGFRASRVSPLPSRGSLRRSSEIESIRKRCTALWGKRKLRTKRMPMRSSNCFKAGILTLLCDLREFQLDRGGPAVSVTVADRGFGFDPGSAGYKVDGGFGLFSIRERLEPLGGSLTIRSAPGQGTTATLRTPLQDDNSDDT